MPVVSSDKVLFGATEFPRYPSCSRLLDWRVTSDIALQKAEEMAEGGESALGPDGEVRSFAPVPAVFCSMSPRHALQRHFLWIPTLFLLSYSFLSKNRSTLA